eukprot:TRINITY_DN14299_c1_g1_i1.p1 TRINITY_DN14299_c1_g1~~TRINITY_DN14299_c1_g1_i1.p1  ORF type:complete len:148 (+),score=20.63 TRINITY_DN14299_c1_g1_i1:35-445(+)
MSALGSILSSHRRTNARMDEDQFKKAEKELRRVGGESDVVGAFHKAIARDLDSINVASGGRAKDLLGRGYAAAESSARKAGQRHNFSRSPSPKRQSSRSLAETSSRRRERSSTSRSRSRSSRKKSKRKKEKKGSKG